MAEGLQIRACFRAPEGSVLLSIDYSQVELRVLAQMADIVQLKDAFREKRDVHKATAASVFGVRLYA